MSTPNDSSTHTAEPKKATEDQFLRIWNIYAKLYPEVLQNIEESPALNTTEKHHLCTMTREKIEKRHKSLGELFSFDDPAEEAGPKFIERHTFDEAEDLFEEEMVSHNGLREGLGMDKAPGIDEERDDSNPGWRRAHPYQYIVINRLLEAIDNLQVQEQARGVLNLTTKFFVAMKRELLGITGIEWDSDLGREAMQRFRERFTCNEANQLLWAVKDTHDLVAEDLGLIEPERGRERTRRGGP
ncbi:hypothetical protein N0V85_003686 [Neurospora sp. IMI 360204]|nr:hypothetical protein N0V85_003686 [Neurospora sp. IMI 360204]